MAVKYQGADQSAKTCETVELVIGGKPTTSKSVKLNEHGVSKNAPVRYNHRLLRHAQYHNIRPAIYTLCVEKTTRETCCLTSPKQAAY